MARDLRLEMGIGDIDRFDPFAAADNLGIPIRAFSELIPTSGSGERALLRSGRVSAMTIFVSKHRREVFYNDQRAPTRVASDLAHELAHALLHHPPHSVAELGGCFGIGREAEEEAAHLSGVLLVPDSVAIYVVSRSLDLETACLTYGVSREMMRWRLNTTGAQRRVARGRRNGA